MTIHEVPLTSTVVHGPRPLDLGVLGRGGHDGGLRSGGRGLHLVLNEDLSDLRGVLVRSHLCSLVGFLYECSTYWRCLWGLL